MGHKQFSANIMKNMIRESLFSQEEFCSGVMKQPKPASTNESEPKIEFDLNPEPEPTPEPVTEEEEDA